MKTKVARMCSVLALLAGVSMLGGTEFNCGFDDDDDIFEKAPVVQAE